MPNRIKTAIKKNRGESMKTNLSDEQIRALKYLHSEDYPIKKIASLFKVRTQRVTQICGRRRPEYDSKYNQTWGL